MTLNKKMIALVVSTSAITGGICWTIADCDAASAGNTKTVARRTLIADADAPAAKTDQKSTDPSSSTTSSAPLQGGTQKVELSLDKLREVGLDIKQVTTSARHLFDEVNIQPVSLNTMPEVVGRGTIIYIPVSTSPAGPAAPPNPKRVAQAMNIMRPIITTLKENADEFVSQHKVLDVSDDAKEKLRPIVKSWVEAADNIAGQLARLEPQTTGPKYDNVAISALCKNIQQDAFVLDKLRRNAYKIIKKENKDSAKDKKDN